jgi:hypothetical protein
LICHRDDASTAYLFVIRTTRAPRAEEDLGQLRAREAGSGTGSPGGEFLGALQNVLVDI